MRVALVLAIILAPLLLPGVQADDAPILDIVAERGPHPLGSGVRVLVRAHDESGAPVSGARVDLAPFGARSVTNRDGEAVMRVSSGDVGAIVLRATLGASAASTTVVWSTPQVRVSAPERGTTGTPVEVTAQLAWAHDGSPVSGAHAGLFETDTLVGDARTNATGVARFLVERSVPGAAEYSAAFDEPALSAARADFTIRWQRSNVLPVIDRVVLALEDREVVATAHGVTDADGDPVELAITWIVDGITRSESGPRVPATLGGRFRVIVTPFDGIAHGPSVGSTELHVAPPPPPSPPPRAAIAGPSSLLVEELGRFDASGSGGAGLSFSWSFSDGASATGASVTHAFGAAGAAWAEVTIRDADGRSSVARVAFDVIPAAPPEREPAPPDATPAPTAPPPPPPANLTEPRPDETLVREVEPDGEEAKLLIVDGDLTLRVNASDAPVAQEQRTLPAPSANEGRLESSLGRAAAGWTLVKARLSEGPARVAYVRGASTWWVEDGEIHALAHDGAEIVVVFEEQLDLAIAVETTSDGWLVRAEALGVAGSANVTVSEADGLLIGEGRGERVEVHVRGPPRAILVAATAGSQSVSKAIALEAPAPEAANPHAASLAATPLRESGTAISWAILTLVVGFLLAAARRRRERE